MQLTGRQIVEEGIITNYCQEGIQQAGIDLRLARVNKLEGSGFVPQQGKTTLPSYPEVKPVDGIWYLDPGYYEITFLEGCKMPNNRAMTFVQRSSLLRCGAIVRSSQFDPGFETECMGTFMQVFHPIKIEVGARVCQTLVMETAEVAEQDMYNGQWQGDNQRKNQ